MIQLEVKYQGKKRVVSFPAGWDELTFRQFLEIRQFEPDQGGTPRLLEILTGIEREAWLNMHAGIAGTLASLLEWVDTPPNYDVPAPKSIKVGDKVYPVPRDLGMETFGQKITLETKVQKWMQEKRDLFELMPDAMAIYFQPVMSDGTFDDKKAEELKEVFYDCRAAEVYPIASFFLRSAKDSIGSGTNRSKAGSGASTGAFKKKQGSGTLKKLMGIFSSSTRLRRK